MHAFKIAHTNLKEVLSAPCLTKVCPSILSLTYRVRNSARQIAKLLRDFPTPNADGIGGGFKLKQDRDDERCRRTEELLPELVAALSDKQMEDMFESDGIDKLRAWLNPL